MNYLQQSDSYLKYITMALMNQSVSLCTGKLNSVSILFKDERYQQYLMDLNSTIDSIAISNNQPLGMNPEQQEKVRREIHNMFKELLAGKGYIKSSNPFELFAYFSDQINHIVHELKDEALQKQQQDKEHQELLKRTELWNIPPQALDQIGLFAMPKKYVQVESQHEKVIEGTVKSFTSSSLKIQEDVSYELQFPPSPTKSKPSIKFTYTESSQQKPPIHKLIPKAKPRNI